MSSTEIDARHMARALELASRGRGFVEPNPMVGCVIARGEQVLGEGWHARFGGPHAEVEALRAAGASAAGAAMYVTLEPCCHHGKTPPCAAAVIEAKLARVVVAQLDPFPRVAGGGVRELQNAGIEVVLGVGESEARRLNAPYLKRIQSGRPWITAKWAMTLDGKIGTHAGSSRWISNELSRRCVHRLRGYAEVIAVGSETALRDDPMLTARPPGPRTALRIVLDSRARLPLASQLVQTAREIPVLIAAGPDAPEEHCRQLAEAGCEIWTDPSPDPQRRLLALLDELGRRDLTNVLVEGGGQLLGSLFDAGEIDEVHVFIASKLVGGGRAPSPLAGCGLADMSAAIPLEDVIRQELDGDVYVQGRLRRPTAPPGAP